MLRDLARLDAFRSLSQRELRTVAAHARRLDVPAGRWLLRRGRRLSGHHYLVRGRVALRSADGRLAAVAAPFAQPVHPGSLELKTLTDCRLLHLSEAGLNVAAMFRERAHRGLIVVSESERCWQTRFLETGLMTNLAPAAWQRVLSRLSGVACEAGEVVIREGRPAETCCFILASGRAEVSRGGRPLAVIEPGELFGEDALIAGEPRNATVRMREAGVVMRFPAEAFAAFLGEVLRGEARHHGGLREGRATLLRLCSTKDLRARLANLDDRVTYLVSSGSEAVAVLAVFLLRKRGVRAFPAAGG